MDGSNALLVAQTYGLWIPTGAILVSAVGAFIAVFAAAKTAKRRATMDMLLREQQDEQHNSLRQKFLQLRDDGNLVQWVNDPKSDQCTVIRGMLNKYELIASGVREGIIDEALYRRSILDHLVKDYDQCKPFIHEVRRITDKRSYYQEFEWLAEKWRPR